MILLKQNLINTACGTTVRLEHLRSIYWLHWLLRYRTSLFTRLPACLPACFLLYFYKLKELILLASGPRKVFPYNVLYTFLVFQVAKFLLGSVAPCGKGGTTATVRYGYSLALLYHRNHERHVWKRELKGQMEMKGVSSNLHNVCILMSQRAESTGVVWWCGIKVKSHGTEGTWTTPALILTTGSYMALLTLILQ